MRIAIAGGHGKIALLLARLLADAGSQPFGIVRNPDHLAAVESAGAEGILLDLEEADVDTLAEKLEGMDAVVFAAGAGPNSGAERKLTLDRDGAILLADAAEKAGVRRYVIVSAIGADEFDPESDDVFQVYLRAKSEADADVAGRDLDWTIVRPGGLTDDPGTGSVTVGDEVERGQIPRADVAAVLAEVLLNDRAVRRRFELVSGGTPIAEALA
ncbi:putative NADH-flavin reductase [Diaminobutyricimonas aerilata]|uniref:Putative NADH-flavin reductase n=1 Tax=Diaminobutyricimonas aerilata TaxID=1162967 RepID=A0A2M9CGQ1_9MICO|nr:SDR family oxidoreductase [Diaminobutyricimonas aerilata]PJJ71103.1 putative NADH-flavin reductase [Diaminobutyricimonas aerilata]